MGKDNIIRTVIGHRAACPDYMPGVHFNTVYEVVLAPEEPNRGLEVD